MAGVEDVLAVRYPNDVWLDVSYFARDSGEAHFLVAVVATEREGAEWEPDIKRVCHSAEEVLDAVAELAPLARDWKV